MKRILIVDDDADIVEMFVHVLRASGRRADGLTSFTAALGVLDLYDVLVTDLRLGPHGSGLDLARAFKRLRPDGIVVLLTGFTNVTSDDVDLVLHKPIDAERLVRSVTPQVSVAS